MHKRTLAFEKKRIFIESEGGEQSLEEHSSFELENKVEGNVLSGDR